MRKFAGFRGKLDAAIALGTIAAFVLCAHWTGVVVCPLRRFVGIPCPTCRSTRAVLRLVRGDFAGAFTLQPLVTGLLLLVPIALLVGWRRGLRLPRTAWERGLLCGGIVCAVALNWAYVLWREGV